MGMTIDNSLELFEDNFTVINTHGHYTEEEESQAIETAIETMRKYQKIERIIEVWHQDIYAKDFECIAEVAEVVEDGKN